MTKKIIMKMFCLKAGTKWLHRCLMVAAFSGLLLNTARAESVEESAIAALQMQKDVTGVVLDEFGDPVIGASVSVVGTTNGTITDIDGRFTLHGVADNATLNVSYLGYQTATVRVDSRNSYSITLKEDTKLIDEVIVIGYGTTTRKHVVGAVGQISEKMIKDRPVSNLTQALQGASANLIIQQKSMNPNDNSMNINIRGISTINNNDPLIVIDGITADGTDWLKKLNPNDIESVSILKDAGSSAIYGSRSANGVIIVTTKKGQNNMKPVVSFSASLGSQNPDILIRPIKGYQNALLRNESLYNSGQPLMYSGEEIAQFAKGDGVWGMDAIMKNALQQNYNLSVQGGSQNTSYMISFGYYDQESNLVGQDFGLKRYNFRSNIQTQIGRLKLTTIMAYDRTEGRYYNGDTGFLFADAMRTPAYNIYPFKEDGKYYNNDDLSGNVLAGLEQGGLKKYDDDHLQAIINAEFDIWKGLKARAVLGYDLIPEHRVTTNRYVPIYNYKDRETIINENNSNAYHINDYSGKATILNAQFMLDYERTFNKVHRVNALFGYTVESYRQERHEIHRRYVDPDTYGDTDDTIYHTDSYNIPGGTTERSIRSWLGRVGYSYMDKYYVEASARYDGTSKFASVNRWGFFPSASLGWRISEEDFFSFWKEKLGDLKIRGSFGVLGNQSVDDYQFLTTYFLHSNKYSFHDSAVTGTGYTFGNSNLKWETTSTFDIGVDASFLNNNLTVSYDYFYKYTNDILLKPLTPGTLGGAVPKANIGAMRNQGWEVTINYRLNHSEFNHNFGFNVGYSYNKVLDYGNQDIPEVDGITRLIREGVPLNSYYGYKTDGYFQNQEEIDNAALPIGAKVEPGDVRYVDRNGDGVIDENDRYILGNAFPRYTFGFNYTLEWKGIDFSMFWQGVGKRDMALRGEMVEPFHGSYYFTMFEHQLDYWRPDNPNAQYPRLVNSASPSYANNYGYCSDRNLYNAAYLRLKNLQIGYTIPKHLTQKAGITKARIYFTGQNLFTITKHKFIDPESSEFGNSMNTNSANSGRNYPTLKYYGGGIEIVF